MPTGETKDRRVYPRLNLDFNSGYKNLSSVDGDTSSRHALTHDISLGGIRFSSKTPIELSDQLIYLLTLPSLAPTMRIEVRPVWIVQNDQDGTYEMGAQFVRIEEAHKNRITEFQQNHPDAIAR